MPETIYVESYPGDEIAWIHFEPGTKHCRPVEVSDTLYKYLSENPIEPDSPLAELAQTLIMHGYNLGG